ncbi:hypothetical protein [Rubrivivax gelatinosus]|uniref:Uncharacterized protein n=1 Tax=Rubrivivax gelatinosus TaxID=28068 RepID=A0A4V2SHN3_RUBGE|nr:hypothetical protein [Rubrivivax gelatinosus]MBK1686232.1 hypothetical protein [Rubrivivax gelatinosus]TCP05728.1 hypothetical protein EV684_101602 [Rubrivivax gelatinosus]
MCKKSCSGACRCANASNATAVDAVNALGAALSQPPAGGKQMTDEWLVEQAGRAAWIAAAGFAPEAQEAAFLRGIANRVLMSFGSDPAAALAIPFSGRLRAGTEVVHREAPTC